MVTNNPPDESTKFPIVLEPPGTDVITPSDQTPPTNWRPPASGDSEQAIPDRAGFNCPDCDYDLRGRSERTCPECGQRFTIASARVAGLANDPNSNADYLAIRRHRLEVRIWSGIFVATLFAPVVMFQSAAIVFLQIVAAISFLGFGLGYHFVLARPADETTMVTTLLYATVTAVLVWLFW